MEFVLETNGDESKDLYLSVRSSKVRKICPARAGQKLAFPAADKSKVKLELLAQVGCFSLPADFDPCSITIPGGYGVDVGCARTLGEASEKEKSSSYSKERFKNANATKKYLDEANVAELCEEVVRELLKHKPADARAFLRQHFADDKEREEAVDAQKAAEAARSELEVKIQELQSNLSSLTKENEELKAALAVAETAAAAPAKAPASIEAPNEEPARWAEVSPAHARTEVQGEEELSKPPKVSDAAHSAFSMWVMDLSDDVTGEAQTPKPTIALGKSSFSAWVLDLVEPGTAPG